MIIKKDGTIFFKLNNDLRKARKDTGYSQFEICNKVNIPISTYRRYEQGLQPMKFGEVRRLIEFYDDVGYREFLELWWQ